LQSNRASRILPATGCGASSFPSYFYFRCFSVLATLCLLAAQFAHAQVPDAAGRAPLDRELIAEGMASYGNYRIFAEAKDCKLYTAGLEYDRHSWGYFLKARLDYVAEALPLVLLREPTLADVYGNPKTKDRQIVPGVGFSPIGLRVMWRNNRAIRPYLITKGGLIVFDKKVLSPNAAYLNFSVQYGLGLQARLSPRLDLRMGFSDFHFSNAFIVRINPGLDVMSSNVGLSYHFGR